MITRRGLLVSLASGLAAIGLTGLGAQVSNAAKTFTVCKTSAIPVKGGKTFSVGGNKVLITQPKKGSFRAYVAVCTHQGGALNGAENNEIACNLHGAKFDAATGMAKSVASRPLAKVAIAVSAGTVKVKF